MISYIAQRGNCKKCGSSINANHLSIELVAGLLGGIALFVSPSLAGLAGAIFGWLLLTLAVLDVQHHWLPNRLTALLAISGLLVSVVSDQPDITARLIGGISGYLSLFLIAKAYRHIRGTDGLGAGDAKMLGAIGCWLGWTALPLTLLGASVVGMIAIIIAQAKGQEVTATSAFPLGSFMAITAFPLWLYQIASQGTLLLP